MVKGSTTKTKRLKRPKSRLLEIQDRLLENIAQMALTERSFAEHPSRALQSSLRSLEKLRASLEKELNGAAIADQNA